MDLDFLDCFGSEKKLVRSTVLLRVNTEVCVCTILDANSSNVSTGIDISLYCNFEVICFTEEKIQSLEQELANANDLLSVMKSQGNDM